MNVNTLVGTQVGKYSGPILVVGGAPGMPEELKHLVDNGFDLESCLIISANEHAIHAGLKPQFACVNDDIHHTLNVHQEPRIRALIPGVKLLSRHWWADYRSPQLMACNSGLKSLLYAAILGANPIIVIGVQNYSNGLYFHEDHGKRSNPNLNRSSSYFSKQITPIRNKLQGVPVRTVTGPLTKIWPVWDPAEQFAPRGLCEPERKAQHDAAGLRYVYAKTESVAFEAALVPQHTVFAVTTGEYMQWGRNGDIADATEWNLADTNEDLRKLREQGRIEQVRLRGLIHKLRTSKRGISRSIYDADIVRVIKWIEEGQTPDLISKRTGLPKEQVFFMAGAMGLTAA